MSAGTPYLVVSASQAAGQSLFTPAVTANTKLGDTIAVWVSTNASSNNILGMSDTQNNVYAAQGAASSGTNAQGQWFVAGPSNNPGGPAALTVGTDNFVSSFTGTGGTKTVQAIGCSGLTGAADENSGPEHGTGTSISYTTPATNQNGDLMLAAELHANAGGTPVTWGSSLASPTLTNQQHTGSAQYANVAALVQATAGIVTTTITVPNSANWAAATITLLAAGTTTGGGPQVRIGATIPDVSLNNAGCYASTETQAAADTNFCTLVGRGIGAGNSHLAVTKKFWGVSDYGLGKNDLVNYSTFGTKIIFALIPPTTGGTAADQTALANFLAALQAPPYNFTAETAVIVLWQEPEGKAGPSHFGNNGSAAYATQMAFFGPIVNASGLPLAQDVGMGAGVAVATAFLNAGYGTGVKFAAQYADYYYGPFARGVTLAEVASIADANSVPFGLGEFGVHGAGQIGVTGKPDDYTSYFNYLTGFLQARLVAFRQGQGSGICDAEFYQGQCSPTGAGDQTSPILTPTDPRIPLFDAMFDTLTSIPAGNTITVTSPGNQTGTAGTAITPLVITATDSDPSQHLTFTAAGLPAGLSISAAGTISGTPAAAGVSNVTVTATDGTGATGTTGFSWNISPVVTNTVTVTNPGAQSTQLGAQVSLTVSATDSNGADGPPFTWGASGLPPGLVIGLSTGTISGQPTTVGAFTVTVTATDSIGSAGSATFTWQITNPNVLPPGQFTTLPPVSPSPVAGLGPAEELSYEICFGLIAGTGSTIPFTAVTLQFYDFDALPSLQSPVATVTFRCPMGTLNDPNGPAVIFGRGPMRGEFMRVQAHNVDTVAATLANLTLVGTARAVERDDWRWDCGGNAPVIPGYINAQAATSSLILGGATSISVPHGTTVTRLCSMYAGQAFARVRLFPAGPASVTLLITPQPPSLFNSQDLIRLVVPNTGSDTTMVVPLPRGPCLLQLVGDPTTDATVSAELIAIET